MSLDHNRKVFEAWGRTDPMHAALTRSGYEEAWTPEAFFARGREEIGEVMEHMAKLPVDPGRERALDFGCGAGRLTRALADEFERVIGLDIAASMVEAAREHNAHPGRVSYRVNTSDRLEGLDDASFDFVYSSKTLQHIPPPEARGYIREFMRVLRAGGVAVFQIRNGPHIPPGSFREWLYRLKHQRFRRWWKRIRGRRVYEMHWVNRDHVAELIRDAGGRVVDVADLSTTRPELSLRMVAEKVA